ncbi:hypothetical protein AMAG_00820 [Allomyces macrogynus ATCC 38327]|uniref:Small ribosomal subunit protein mS38 n=1 Tax=Allomyces macrogynus (strain ATCC 38327) TaxID=578462 RepID=A0A0L0RWV0_ALLM3|nr:hypothetical protein AMAG_00820 [Allomyces macrogynus ATCC 38327]|eukprot:KNE54872.1 hypothetical protein AMAG_00820 [Allomyces macrogynus ATCC 38327]
MASLFAVPRAFAASSAMRAARAPAAAVNAAACRRFKHDSARSKDLVAAVPAGAIVEAAAPATPALVKDESSTAMSSFLTSLRAPSSATAFADGAAPARDLWIEFPLMRHDHPLVTDDYYARPPFQAPPMANEAVTAITTLTPPPVPTEAPEPVPVFNSALFPYVMSGECPLLPSAELMVPADSSAILDMWAEKVMGEEENGMYATSVLRKRRKKMNKHKLRKLRKRTRSERK